jgi:2,3-bisphosphoglycerate-dependent phosphoglycerate mutase
VEDAHPGILSHTSWLAGAVSDLHCPARIVVARHGEAEYETPEMNATGGSLTDLGRAQARDLGERLRHEKVAGVVCSELSRAVQTAEIAAAVLGLPVRVRERLQEFPAGDYLGRPYDHGFFGSMVAAWVAGDLSAGVPGGETGQQTADRVLTVLEDLADQFRGETVLVVSHGGVILALWGAIAPGSPDAPASDGVANASAYVFERDADGWRAAGRV